MKTHREPTFRISKRGVSLPRWKNWGIRGIALIASLILCAIIIFAIVKLNPLKVYGTMFEGAFGTSKRSWVTIRDAMMLLCIAIGLAPAFKMRFWNIGAEGQVLVGGIVSAACMIYLGGKLPNGVLIPLMFLCSIVAGAIWGIIPGIFKAKWNTNETLFTLMMNYIAIQLTSFFVSKWEYPFGSNTVGIIPRDSSKAGWLPNMFSSGFNSDFGWNVLIVLVLTVAMFIYLKYTKQGYEIAVVGESENTARYAGIKVSKVYIRTMLLSGAICGLAGFVAVSGAAHSISTSTAGGRGFTAIVVAWLGKLNPFSMMLVAFGLVFMQKGSLEIASQFNLNENASEIITGIILFFILGCEFFINYRLEFRKHEKEAAKA